MHSAFLEKSGAESLPALEGDDNEVQPQPAIRDNRNLVDTSTAQRLDQTDIQRLKDSGAQASEIVGALITSSKTFKGKTAFSQEKYIKKKLQKLVPFVLSFHYLFLCSAL